MLEVRRAFSGRAAGQIAGPVLGLGLALVSTAPAEAKGSRDKHEAAAPNKDRDKPTGDGMQVSGSGLGGQLDAPACEKVLREAAPEVKKCYEDAASRLFYLGGRIEAKLTIGASGQLRAVALTTSTVGSYDVERCITTALGKLRFPPPKGGDGELTYPVEFAAKTPVGSFSEQQVLGKLDVAKLKSCQAKAKKPKAGDKTAAVGAMRATLYVGPGGQVTAVGFAADEPIDDGVAKCLRDKIQAARLDDPLGKMVKASVDLGAADK
jgi:hypothetical protein